MNKRRIFIFVIIILMFFSCYPFSYAEEQVQSVEAPSSDGTQTEENGLENLSLSEQKQKLEEKIQQANSDLEYVQGELSASLQKTLELDDKIVDYESEIRQYEQEISDLQNTIENTAVTLKEIEEKCKQQEQLLEKRLVAMYQAGETSYLDFLLTSDGIIDFISNYYLVAEISEYDTNLLNETEKQKKNIEEIKQKYDNDKAQIKIKKAKVMQMSTIMQNNKALQIIYQSQLSEQEIELRNQIEQYKQQEKNVEASIAQALNFTSHYGLKYSGGIMAWPVVKEGSFITSDYGTREHPISGVIKKHTGIDISGGYGVPIIAAADGIVSFAGTLGGYGNCVVVDHGDGISTLYGHGQLVKTTVNAEVKKGDVIMEMGSTGNSTGPHLHFEVRINNVPTNPISYLRDNNTNNNVDGKEDLDNGIH